MNKVKLFLSSFFKYFLSFVFVLFGFIIIFYLLGDAAEFFSLSDSLSAPELDIFRNGMFAGAYMIAASCALVFFVYQLFEALRYARSLVKSSAPADENK